MHTQAIDIPSARADSIRVSGSRQAAEQGERTNGTMHSSRPTDDVFAEALRDDSNQELDWLWAASQVTDVDQRRYCLERALAINAQSALARQELAKLHPGRHLEVWRLLS